MPSLGDFFRIGLPRSFCGPWDAWVQMILSSSRADLGARWQACYMSAPIWRFRLAPGLAGPVGVAGVLMPSVDRVGRAFPLTLAVVGADAAPQMEALEEVALAALEDDMTQARLADQLARVPLCPAVPVGAGRAVWQALIGDVLEEFNSTGLPDARDGLRLFDPALGTARA